MATATRKLAQAPFQFDPQLTAVANLTVNENLINDLVLPIVRVSQETFKYLEIPVGENFTIPETLIGLEGEPNEMTFSATEQDGSVEGHALTAKVPGRAMDQAQPNYDPRGRASEGVADLIRLRKEINMAETVFEATNYPANRKTTLSGVDQWSDPTSDPIREILETKDLMVMRPNVLILGREVATQLILHPAIVKAFHRNEGDSGVVNISFLAALLGFERVLVGDAWYNPNNAVPSSDPSLVRAWGKKAAMLHASNITSQMTNGLLNLSWGVTFLWPVDGNDLATFTWFDPKPGVKGADWIKVAHQYRHVVVAPDHGWLFIDAVA